MQTTIPKN